MQRHGWILLFHDCITEQLQKLHTAAERARRNDPQGFEGNANVKLFRALSQLILDVVPGDPGRDEYRQGNTLGRLTGTGGEPKSEDASACSFAMTPGPGPSYLPGSTMRKHYVHPAANQILMRSSKRCLGAAIHRMIGKVLSHQADQTGKSKGKVDVPFNSFNF
jgi:hypothetical protein